MANLKRHFNFSKGHTLSENSNSSPLAPPVQFDKHNFMNNICSCLDICCSYIQALNSLCGAGSLLARNLLQTVQNVPAYYEVAQQFSCVWDEVGKATAGASAAVKTETLMMLQEVLNTLEMTENDHSANSNQLDNFQVIGSCLYSFIELQAQFSMSTWKSMSKLSKNFSNDAFLHSLHFKSQDRHTLKASKNSELSSTIKKHYSHLVHKYDAQKVCDPVGTPQSQFYLTPVILSDNIQVQGSSTENTLSEPGWTPSANFWSAQTNSKQSLESNPTKPVNNSVNKKSSSIGVSDLDEVINLLSCMPASQKATKQCSSPSRMPTFDPNSRSYQFWPQGSGPISSRHMSRPLSEGNRNINFGYDSWIWRTDNMNCSALPVNEFGNSKLTEHKKSSWDSIDYNRWNFRSGENGGSSDDASSTPGEEADSVSLGRSSLQNNFLLSSFRQRRYSSSDGLTDIQEIVPDAYLWNVHSQKTSTWPLKQLSSRFVATLDLLEQNADPKCTSQLYDTPP